jgi:hypothetical protein
MDGAMADSNRPLRQEVVLIHLPEGLRRAVERMSSLSALAMLSKQQLLAGRRGLGPKTQLREHHCRRLVRGRKFRRTARIHMFKW